MQDGNNTTEQEKTKARPFHESIVRTLGRARYLTELHILGQLITDTEIPENHDKIRLAWINRMTAVGQVDNSVLAHLNEQKRLAEVKSEEKSVPLDELHREAEELHDPSSNPYELSHRLQ